MIYLVTRVASWHKENYLVFELSRDYHIPQPGVVARKIIAMQQWQYQKHDVPHYGVSFHHTIGHSDLECEWLDTVEQLYLVYPSPALLGYVPVCRPNFAVSLILGMVP